MIARSDTLRSSAPTEPTPKQSSLCHNAKMRVPFWKLLARTGGAGILAGSLATSSQIPRNALKMQKWDT